MPEDTPNLLRHTIGIVIMAHVALHQEGSAAHLLDLFHQLLGRGLTAQVIHGHIRSLGGQRQGNGPSNPAGSSGHHCCTVDESHIRVLSSRIGLAAMPYASALFTCSQSATPSACVCCDNNLR